MKDKLFRISIFTLLSLFIILTSIIILICILFNFNILIGIIISILIIILKFLLAPIIIDIIMEKIYKTKFIDDIPDYLKKYIENTCNSNNMIFPRIGIIDNDYPNIFTYGHYKNNARIIISKGIFSLLEEDEVKAVLAHEIGHAINYDLLFITGLELGPLTLYGLYEIIKGKKRIKYFSFIFYFLYYISNYIVLFLSRIREYYADYFAIKTLKSTKQLTSSLIKIGYGLKNYKMSSNTLEIFNKNDSIFLLNTNNDSESIKKAIEWEKQNYWSLIYEFNSTHPLLSKRLENINKYSKDYNEDSFIIFDTVKEKIFSKNFIIELIINYIPYIFILLSLLIYLFNIYRNIFLLILIPSILFFIKFIKRYNNKDKKEYTTNDLLSIKEVSHINSIPCILEGNIIYENDKFMIKDSTGIMLLNNNYPVFIQNKILYLFKLSKYSEKKVLIEGWYRRNPIPYIEIKSIMIENDKKLIRTVLFIKIFYYILLILLLLLSIYYHL